MSCYGCNQDIDYKKSLDESTRKLAKERAKETGTTIGLIRNGEGLLEFAEPGQPAIEFYTPVS